jgi:hypothetical protein
MVLQERELDQNLMAGQAEENLRKAFAEAEANHSKSTFGQASQVGETIAKGTEGASSLPGITDARTSGTPLWVQTDSAATTVEVVAHMGSLGVLVKQN